MKETAPHVVNMVPALVAQIRMTEQKMNAQDVTNNLWAAATLDEAAPDVTMIVPVLVSRIPRVAKEMTSQGLSNCLWAAATLRVATPDLLEVVPVLVSHFHRVANDMNPQNVSNCLWAAATLMEAEPQVLKIVPMLVPQILKIVEHMNQQNVANCLWASARLAYNAPDVLSLVKALFDRALTFLQPTKFTMKPQELSNSLQALALLQDFSGVRGVLSDDSMRTFAQRVVNHSNIFLDYNVMSKADLRLAVATVVWACARLQVHDEMFLQSVSDQFDSVKECCKLSDWGLCAMLWSYKSLDQKKHHRDFRKRLKTAAEKKGFYPEDVHNSQFGSKDWVDLYYPKG